MECKFHQIHTTTTNWVTWVIGKASLIKWDQCLLFELYRLYIKKIGRRSVSYNLPKHLNLLNMCFLYFWDNIICLECPRFGPNSGNIDYNPNNCANEPFKNGNEERFTTRLTLHEPLGFFCCFLGSNWNSIARKNPKYKFKPGEPT